MEYDPIPNQDEDYDGDEWDAYPDLIPRLIWFHYAKMGLSYAEWLNLLTPLWFEQIQEKRNQGYLWWE